MQKIPFGLRPSGRLVEVAEVERGLACNCRCPGCGEPLLAKKGAVNVQHFAHIAGSECSNGAETSLHHAAKQVVADKLWIQLPPLEVPVSRKDPECGLFRDYRVFGVGDVWRFDRVEVEMAVGTVRPDAVGFAGPDRHAVEILVTHRVDEEKQALLAGLQIPAIEVNLATLVGKVFTFKSLEAAVIESTENKRWLFHPRKAEWEALLLSGFDAWRKARLAALAEAALRRTHSSLVTQANRQDAYRAANERYRALPDTEKWTFLERQLGISRRVFPSHLRVALREGADSISGDKELWQGALFAQFVLSAPGKLNLGKRMPSDASLGIWLTERFGANGRDLDLPRRAARSYLNYLKACGFLRWQAGGLFVAHDQLNPPPKESPRPPALSSQQSPAASVVRPPTSVPWSAAWPDTERLFEWADELSASVLEFDSEWFVNWLLSLRAPAPLQEVQRAFAEADGDASRIVEVLRGLGVVTDSWRCFSFGDSAPWLMHTSG